MGMLGDFTFALDVARAALGFGWHGLQALWHGHPDIARDLMSSAWQILAPHQQVWVSMLLVWLGVVATVLGILKGWGLWVLVPTLFLFWFLAALAIAVWFNMLPLLLVACVILWMVCGTTLTRRTKRGGESTK